MPDYKVAKRGHDPNGRPIFMTGFMADWWERVVDDLGFRPTIVQGAFMARVGGGAAASAGYHDLGGCLDLRVWDLTADQVEKTIRTLRRMGAAAWLRNKAHGGFDPHIHLVLGADHPLTTGAASQWRQYMQGRDGLASNGPDYHWRPKPLVLEPPEDDIMAAADDILAAIRELRADLAELRAEVDEFAKDQKAYRELEMKRNKREVGDDKAKGEQLDRIEGQR